MKTDDEKGCTEMYADTHDDYDVFWEQKGRVVEFAIVGHEVGARDLPPGTVRISLPYSAD